MSCFRVVQQVGAAQEQFEYRVPSPAGVYRIAMADIMLECAEF